MLATSAGAAVGILGGLIGLGGAEFRLPLLIGVFGYSALPAIILNKAMSLAVVASALPFRASTVPFQRLLENTDIILTLLTGSLAGAWFGAGWATRMKSRLLYRVLSILLVVIAFVLLFGHDASASPVSLSGAPLAIAGASAGFAIGVVASLMGVAGGELLIPTIVLLFGADIRLAGSLSLAVSLPTMIVGFSRYSRDQSFSVMRTERRFVVFMVIGSLAGAFIGSQLLGIISTGILLPLLAGILLLSAVKVWNHA
ncbi:MAG: sulfite exporter TauE/SafE family protein [Betaproteobacteria bacterium]|nr:sulfite exporter TauE/SafE family protein [Betaproteobacteria bacterium]MCL2886143.1 sulfite exporter TauE/SafE family protein [Betaproteobacteria bacterium]